MSNNDDFRSSDMQSSSIHTPDSSQSEGTHEIDTYREERQKGTAVVPVVSVRNLTKIYRLGQTEVRALQDVSLDVAPGEFVAVVGPSGSGKTTFMNLIGCMDRPTSGEYWLTGIAVSKMEPNQLADIRNRRLGFIFQNFNLLTRETALTNVMLPLVYRGLPEREQRRRAALALQMVGLKDRMNHLPTQLSGGQQQRVAIARALVSQPSLLLADEPTGNLDSHTSQEILELLKSLNEQGITLIVVTHNMEVARVAKRIVEFKDGSIIRDEATQIAPSNEGEK
ncbi:MAG TPA: ABC transporter ATP-binding protein [Ktedonobacteraceae bacterium]|nr:ABC transporter ATP-binding protein [Ktedonobacteraceae bacterium]